MAPLILFVLMLSSGLIDSFPSLRSVSLKPGDRPDASPTPCRFQAPLRRAQPLSFLAARASLGHPAGIHSPGSQGKR
jgi:hypothetical protein